MDIIYCFIPDYCLGDISMHGGDCQMKLFVKKKRRSDVKNYDRKLLHFYLTLRSQSLLNKVQSFYDNKWVNHIAFRTAKTLWSFGCSECNRAKLECVW